MVRQNRFKNIVPQTSAEWRMHMADIFQGNFQKRDEEIKKLLRIEDSFDLIRRRFVIGGRQAAF